MAKKQTARAKLSTRRRSAISLGVALLLVAAVSFVALNGFGHGFLVRYMLPWGEAIPQGMEISGGVTAVYQAERTSENANRFTTLVSSAVSVLQSRLSAKSLTAATVTKLGSDRVRIEIPGIENPNEVFAMIGKTARLQIKNEGGDILLENADIQGATAGTREELHIVTFQLTDEASERIAQATAENPEALLSIVLDGGEIAQGPASAIIADGVGTIEREGMTAEAAAELSLLLQSGALPLNMAQTELLAISAVQGAKLLDRAVLAAIVAGALVLLLLLARYRLLGLAADITLIVCVLFVVFLLAVFGAQLTLLGVAGIVLGIGMAIGGNVIILERVRDELKGGKQLRVALRTGYHSVFSTITPSVVAVVIVALVLLQLGTGSVRGFAVTMLVSVVASTLVSVVISRRLLNLFAGLGIKNTKLYLG